MSTETDFVSVTNMVIRQLCSAVCNMAELGVLVTEEPKENKRYDNKNYTVKKRPPVKPVEGDNVIFVTKKTNFKAQLEKCIDLLTKGEREIILHGLGAAILRCCNLAIQVQLSFSGTHDIEINTGTIDLVDDLIPKVEDLDFDTRNRYQSSVHIRIFRTAVMGATQ